MELTRKETGGGCSERGVIGRYGIVRAEILFRSGIWSFGGEYVDR